MKISVVVPVYDTEKYLKRCLDSIINQTFDDIELIIVNDGSPDNSREIILEYAANNSNIVFIDIENKGVSNARNLGLKNANGEYIIFVDSDDYLDLSAIEKLYNAITFNKCDMAVCNFAMVYDSHINDKFLEMPKEKLIIANENKEKLIKDTLSFKFPLAICVFNKLFSTKLLLDSGIVFEERSSIYAEDAYFYYKMISLIERICIVDEPLYLYYQRETSVTNSYKPNFVPRVINFLNGLDKYYNNKYTQALKLRAFVFLPEILANECLLNASYIKFKENISIKELRKWIKDVDLKDYNIKNRMLYFLYMTKQYKVLYLIFNNLEKRREEYVKTNN